MNYIIGALLMIPVIFLFRQVESIPEILSFFISILISIVVYFGYLYLRKDELFDNLLLSQIRKLYAKRKF